MSQQATKPPVSRTFSPMAVQVLPLSVAAALESSSRCRSGPAARMLKACTRKGSCAFRGGLCFTPDGALFWAALW